jgi:nicotinate dehydrogenase subunit B
MAKITLKVNGNTLVVDAEPERPALGGGEPSGAPVAAAIANAIFDATGVRLREAPFTPARILVGLKKRDLVS